MKYIVIKRFKRKGMDGEFNIPYGTQLDEIGGVLFYNGKKVCNDHSAVMREYFTRDDDGNGKKRAKLAKEICDTLHIREGETQEEWDERWKVVWKDELCRKYNKQPDSSDWLWNIEFYNAPIEDLEYIKTLIK